MTRRLVQWLRRVVGQWLIAQRNRRRWEKLRGRYD
jgi:hypothetical protein